jgi:hypothetical protein
VARVSEDLEAVVSEEAVPLVEITEDRGVVIPEDMETVIILEVEDLTLVQL